MSIFKASPLVIRQIRTISATAQGASTVDASEINFFKEHSSKWWDPNSIMKPLHSMNEIRVPFIRDGLINAGNVKIENVESAHPLKDLNILDVGCGGGILTESLARLGPQITGVDATDSLVQVAKQHAALDSSLHNLLYVKTSIEEFCMSNSSKFDAVVVSEVIEHITSKEAFIKACVDCLRPGGSIFFTTFNKTVPSHVLGVLVPEYVLDIIPRGTHSWDKFIPPQQLQRILEDNDCYTKLIHGTFYNPFTNNWSWTSNNILHYALHALKNK